MAAGNRNTIMTATEKLAKILRTKPEVLEGLARRMEAKTGKTGVMEKIVADNEALVRRTLGEVGLDTSASPEEVYQALMKRLTAMDEELYGYLDKPDLMQMGAVCGKLRETAIALAPTKTGFFIKQAKAVELLSKFPPQNLLDHFGYATVQELVDKQSFSSVFASLRFAQDDIWMHKFFDESYRELKPEDFEEREVELKVLEPEWLAVADKFMKHKYHNVSHLKELGIIFVVPIKLDIPGETVRMFTLLLHYLNEVPFYSKLFRKFALEPDFISRLQSLLRGDVPEGPAPANNVRIVQRYLAKDDENDFRLLEPHMNPEAEHWYKAEGDLKKLAIFGADWQELDFVGDFFGDQLVSFDLIDLIMSLVDKKSDRKYLYHQEEALWNKIFVEYLGRDIMNELIEKNIIGGFIKF